MTSSINKRLILLLILVVSSIFIVSCGSNDDITIAWIGPLTGPVNLLGVENIKAVELAIQEYNSSRTTSDPQVLLIVKDDQYNVEKSIKAYQEIVDQNADVLFLNTYSAMFMLADDTLQDNIIVINPIDNDAKLTMLGDNAFMIAKRTGDLGELIAKDILDSGKKKAFILYLNDDEFMPNLAESVELSFQSGEGEVLLKSYSAETSDFSTFLPFAEAADSIVLLGYSELGTAMQQFRGAGIDTQFYTANIGMEQSSNGSIEGTKFTYFTVQEGNIELAEEFLTRYELEYGTKPIHPWTAMQAYDATTLVLNSLHQTSSSNFADQLRDQLYNVNDFTGTSGNITILRDGSSRGIYWSIYTYKGGEIVKE
jgi:branched-chain amino acid transport system substrate-binding protein